MGTLERTWWVVTREVVFEVVSLEGNERRAGVLVVLVQ